jgi:hypothetical protein
MELLGERNWWLPGWLARSLPVIHVESTQHALEPFSVRVEDNLD